MEKCITLCTEISELPMNVTVSINNNNIVTVNWSNPSLPVGIEMEYILTLVFTQSTGTSDQVLVNNTQSYQFEVSQREACHDFELKISVSTVMGTTEMFNITGRFPVLPENISHSVLESGGNSTLTVIFDVREISNFVLIIYLFF